MEMSFEVFLGWMFAGAAILMTVMVTSVRLAVTNIQASNRANTDTINKRIDDVIANVVEVKNEFRSHDNGCKEFQRDITARVSKLENKT